MRELSRHIDKDTGFVAAALRAMPVVNQPCEAGCGVLVVRSCRRDRVLCGDCDFKARCAAGIDLDAVRRQAQIRLEQALHRARRTRRIPYRRLKKAA